MNTIQEFTKPQVTYSDILRFTPYAWSKLLYMQNSGKTEVAGYCVTETDDPLLVTDFILIKQECTSVTFELDETDMAEYQENMLDRGLAVWQFSRILAHTHPPGCSPSPSGVDEDNFKKIFNAPDWAIMFIIADDGSVYCRLKINTSPGVEKLLKVIVDYRQQFIGSDYEQWKNEYKTKVHRQKFVMTGKEGMISNGLNAFQDRDSNLWYNEEEDNWINVQKPAENYQVDDKTCDDIECFWDTTGCVVYWDDDTDSWFTYDPGLNKWYKEDCDEDDISIEYIDPPNQLWVRKVIEWSKKYKSEKPVMS